MKTMICAAAAAFAAGPALAEHHEFDLGARFEAAVEAEDIEALLALYAEDAVSYGPDGSVMTGHAAIADGWAGFFEGFENFEMTLEPQGSQALGGDARAEWGMWTMSYDPAGGGDRITARGRYTDVAVMGESGWVYAHDHASMLAENVAGEDAPEAD